MKNKILSVILAMIMVFSIGGNVFASYDPTSYGYGYNDYNSGYYGNSYNSIYSGDNYYNYNYGNYYGSFYMSSWAEDMKVAYDPTWYESPQRQVVRGEAFLLFLRAVQRSLDRQGYSRFMSGFNSVPFTDYSHVNPYAQSEVNVLYANGILVGFDDNTMRFSQKLTRAEMAAIYSRFNRIYFNMGPGYSQWNYDGYNNYYNNNYNNYYNNYVFNDIHGHWAAQDIITAAANGVIKGMGNGYFDTEGPLTIEQIWKILDSCAGYQGLKRSDIAYAMSQTFKVKFGKNIDESYGTLNGKKITRLSASPTTTSITEGSTQTIKVNISPSNASYQKLQWSFDNYSDNTYATIEEAWNSSSGVAYVRIYGRRAKNSYMTLKGRAMDGSGKYVSVKIKVTEDYDYDYDYDEDYITSITPSEETIYLNVGQSKQINARIKPSTADYKNLKWTSQNSNIAGVSSVYLDGSYSYGTITGYNPGTTYVNINSQDGSGESAEIKVVVNGNSSSSSYITSATANPSYINMNVGNTQNVNISLYPVEASDKNTTWISDNESVARVEKFSNTSIRIVGVSVGTTNVRGIAQATGKEICVIPVTITNNGFVPGPGTSDVTKPIVTLEGANNVNIGEPIVITIKAYDETALEHFDIGVDSIIGMTGALSPTKIEKMSNSEFRVTLMGVEVASQCICVKAGTARDKAGNSSAESNEIVIFVNSGEE